MKMEKRTIDKNAGHYEFVQEGEGIICFHIIKKDMGLLPDGSFTKFIRREVLEKEKEVSANSSQQ